jgi:hypothetical protein
MRTLLLLLCLLAHANAAAEFGRTLRALRADDRQRRREALETFANGSLRPSSRSEAEKLERVLGRFLSDRFPGTERALAVRALGRLDSRRVFTSLLDRIEEETDDRVLKAAEQVFRKAPPELLDDLVRRVDKAKDPLHRAALVRMMGALPGERTRERMRLRAKISDHWCPRAAALHSLARDRHRAAFPPLMISLADSDPGVVTAAAESLARLTGREYGRDVQAWKAWWEAGGRTDPLALPAKKDGEPGRRRYAHEVETTTIAPTYFGIPVKGRRVVFVFDVSASMRYKLPLAYDQLSRAVKALESACEFEVIFFNEHVWSWRGRMSHADPVTKELLLRHLPTLEVKSYTNLFDSIEKALALDPQEIFVISDGAPNRGRKQHPKEILRELKRINTKSTRIHTISVVRVVDGDEHTSLLKAIAGDHGGEHVARTLK